MIDSQPESEEKQRLLSIIDSKLEIEFDLADIRQDSGKYDVAEQCNADILAVRLLSIDYLVNMATIISKKFLLVKCKEQKSSLKCLNLDVTPKMNKIKA